MKNCKSPDFEKGKISDSQTAVWVNWTSHNQFVLYAEGLK